MSEIMSAALKTACRLNALRTASRRQFHKTAAVSGSPYVVDLRSDCLTKPTDKMRQRMIEASCGDDVFDEDNCVHELQDKVTEMFGKEAALFVPSGTMGNFMSILCQCSHHKGLEVLLGDKSHVVLYEQGGLATLGGVHTRAIPTNNDGTFDLDTVEQYIRPLDDPHQPWTAVIGVENTHNVLGGTCLPPGYVSKLKSLIKDTDIKLHMDGARLMNAAVAQNLTPKELLKDVDTVSCCLSKGVGAPIGSVIAGNREFIQRAVRMRKMLGGGWRQPGMLAAAGLCALEDVVPRLQQDHKHAKILASAIMKNHNDIVHIDLPSVQTNIVMINIIKPNLTAEDFCNRLNTITEEENKTLGESIQIQSMPFSKYVARFAVYGDITSKHVQAATAKLNYVLEELGVTQNTATNKSAQVNSVGKFYLEWEPLLYHLSYRKEINI